MKYNMKTYIGLCIVFVLSFLASLALPIDKIFKGIAATPGVFALLGVLYQIFRDRASFEKQMELQRKQHFFNLGVTSHMANVAFDKHVEFCEKYISEVHSTTRTLFSEGPTEDAGEHAKKLYEIRVRYSAWLSADVVKPLDEFEKALLRLSAHTHLSEKTKDRDTMIKAYKRADNLWETLLGELINEQKNSDSDIAIEKIKEKLRKVLGINELISLRKWIVEEASDYYKRA